MLDQVERDQHGLVIPAAAPQRIEVGQPVLLADHGLAIDQERCRLEAASGLDNPGEAVGPIVAALGEAADPRAFPAHHQPEAVMLDFVNPLRAGRWPCDLRRSARFNKP